MRVFSEKFAKKRKSSKFFINKVDKQNVVGNILTSGRQEAGKNQQQPTQHIMPNPSDHTDSDATRQEEVDGKKKISMEIDAELHTAIDEAAARNERTLAGEIRHRLKLTFAE